MAGGPDRDQRTSQTSTPWPTARIRSPTWPTSSWTWKPSWPEHVADRQNAVLNISEDPRADPW